MEDLIGKIKGMTLTRVEAEIAEYLGTHPTTLGLHTATSLADEIGVSDTSVIRFIRRLGYRGYADFRNSMNARIAEQYKQAQQDALMPGEKFVRTKQNMKRDSLVADVSDYTLRNLEISLSKLDGATVDRVSDILLSSRKKYIIGFHGTACCAYYMSNKLTSMLPDVIPLLHADSSAVECLADVGENDCLLVYSFPRYSKLHQALLELARERGARIILITDRLTAPQARLSDIVIVAQINGLGSTNSYTVPICISDVLVLAVINRCDESSTSRMRQLDALMDREQLY